MHMQPQWRDARRPGPLHWRNPVREHRIGQDVQPARLDKKTGMTNPGQAGLGAIVCQPDRIIFGPLEAGTRPFLGAHVAQKFPHGGAAMGIIAEIILETAVCCPRRALGLMLHCQFVTSASVSRHRYQLATER